MRSMDTNIKEIKVKCWRKLGADFLAIVIVLWSAVFTSMKLNASLRVRILDTK
jgi:hypothetical protein